VWNYTSECNLYALQISRRNPLVIFFYQNIAASAGGLRVHNLIVFLAIDFRFFSMHYQ